MSKPWDHAHIVCNTDTIDIYKTFVEAKAAHDFHYNDINNGYKEDSDGFKFYANKINQLCLKELSK